MSPYLILFFVLCVGHALADFALSNEFFSVYKSHKTKYPHIQETIWPWLLGSHALIHAGMVFAATLNIWLALTELVLHALTDYLKSAGRISFHTDQAIHYACKLAYTLLAAAGYVTIHPWYII